MTTINNKPPPSITRTSETTETTAVSKTSAVKEAAKVTDVVGMDAPATSTASTPVVERGPEEVAAAMRQIVALKAHPLFGDGPNAKPGIELTVPQGLDLAQPIDRAMVESLEADAVDPRLQGTDYQRALLTLRAQLPNQRFGDLLVKE